MTNDTIDPTTKQGKIYQLITDRIVSLLEQGEIPWHKPWNGSGNGPLNLISKREYNGINHFLLSCSGYSSPYFLTFKQAKQKGGSVQKGQKGYPVIFWKRYVKEDKETGEKKMVFVLKYYTVFNVEQCDGIEIPVTEEEHNSFNPIESAQEIVENMPNRPNISHQGPEACYWPTRDAVSMPLPEAFISPEKYYSVLFHELGHSTGHSSRLNRPSVVSPSSFGSHEYSKEELIAEMSAAFLCGHVGIENTTIENSAAYIQGWLRVLKNNNKWLIHAASAAQKAADYILNKERKEETEEE